MAVATIIGAWYGSGIQMGAESMYGRLNRLESLVSSSLMIMDLHQSNKLFNEICVFCG